MAVNLYGLNQLEKQPGAILTETDAGLVTYSEVRNGRPDDVRESYFNLLRRVSVNPVYRGLSLESKRIIEGEGGIHSLELQWEGTATDSGDSVNPQPLPSPQFFLDQQPSEEPIDTHPNFAEFGVADNGAKFDDEGLFLGFSNTGAFEDNEFGGLSKYLVGGRTLTRISVYRFVPASVRNTPIPSIDTPPTPPFGLPSLTGRDWLKVDGSINQRGSAFEVREAWRESGPRGWLTEVYS